MQTQTEGLIIKSRDINENDTVVKILTGDLGLISAFANGTKRVKSRTASAAVSPMTYSRLTLYRGRESYIIDDAKAIDVFFGLREDIERLSLANYFCELAGEFSPENTEAHEFLSLTLNLLHLLSEDKRSADFLKPVGELRMLALAGYMPDVAACARCGKTDGNMGFSAVDGRIFCADCRRDGALLPLPAGAVAAVRHVVSCDLARLFSFALPNETAAAFAAAAEQFLKAQLQRSFKTLDFYHELGGTAP